MRFDITAQIERLEALTAFELKREWERRLGTAAPARFSKELLVRGIAHAIQERAVGGLSKSIMRQLSSETWGSEIEVRSTRPRRTIKPGTRLFREWRGATHTVVVLTDGVEWNGKRFASLTAVAKAITGVHWSGPRFFGLTSRSAGLGK